jgi:hypothetical protein
VTLWVLVFAYMALTHANQNGMDGRIEGYEMARPHAQVFISEADCAVARSRFSDKFATMGMGPQNTWTLTCIESKVMTARP